MKNFALGIVIGGSIAPTLGKSFATTKDKVFALGRSLDETKAKFKAVDDVQKYTKHLEALKAKQQQFGASSGFMGRAIAETERRLARAKSEAKRYGIELWDVKNKHRQLGEALRATGAELEVLKKRGGLGDAVGAIGGGIGALGIGSALKGGLTGAIDLEREQAEIANIWGTTRETVAHELIGISGDAAKMAVSMEQSAQIVKKYGAAMGDAGREAGLSAAPKVFKFMAATKAEAEDAANVGITLAQKYKIAGDDIGKAFEAIASATNDGTIETKAFAKEMPALGAQASALGSEGVKGVAALGAAFEVVGDNAGGDAALAANNLANLLGKITDPEQVKRLGELGFDVKGRIAAAKAQGKDVADALFVGLAEQFQAEGGNIDAFSLGEVFRDKQARDALLALSQGLDRYKKIRDKAINSKGLQDEFAAKNLAVTGAAMDRIGNAFSRTLGAIGGVISGLINPALQFFAGGLEWLADAAEHSKLLSAGLGLVGTALTAASSAFAFAKVQAIASALGFSGLANVGGGLVGNLFPMLITGIRAVGVAFMTNPIGLVIGGIALAVGLIYSNWDSVGPFFENLWDRVAVVGKIAFGLFRKFFEWTPLGFLVKNWEPISDFFSGLWESVRGIFSAAGDWIASWWEGSTIGKIAGFLGEKIGQLGGIVNDGIGSALMGAADVAGVDRAEVAQAFDMEPPAQASPVVGSTVSASAPIGQTAKPEQPAGQAQPAAAVGKAVAATEARPAPAVISEAAKPTQAAPVTPSVTTVNDNKTVTVNVNGAQDPRRTAQEVQRAIAAQNSGALYDVR